jgi:LmbE family N-acetylglucosaminyl deacetylase
MKPGIVLSVAPHPDDEAIGAPAVLLGLRRAGWIVLDAIMSLGRPNDHDRRRMEAKRAAERGGFVLRMPPTPFAISSSDDLGQAEDGMIRFIGEVIATERPDVVISPSPHDGHHGHEVVGRAVRDAVAGATSAPTWWMWGLWADLPLPTIYCAFDDELLNEALAILGEYAGEVARNDYDILLKARATANAVLGSERVFGFGASRASHRPYAELLTEVQRTSEGWVLGHPRLFDPASSIALPTGRVSSSMDDWLSAKSLRDRVRNEV